MLIPCTRSQKETPIKITSHTQPVPAKFRQKPILLGILLVLSTLMLYLPVRSYRFIDFLDDDFYITENTHVNSGLHLRNVVWAFTSFYQANWHPLTWISHMADCQFFGLSPGPPHFVNVVLHALNVFLLFSLLRNGTGALWRSLLVAALFAAHPLNVETVAWVAERKSLLCTLFSLLTVAAYGWYVRRPRWHKYSLMVIAYSLALMSKPMAVSLPITLLLVDYWPLQRFEGFALRDKSVCLWIEKMPLFLLSAASCVVTLLAQRSVGAVANAAELPLSLRLENAVVSYVAYIGKTIWPANLSVFYPHPWESLPWLDVFASTIILVAITAAALYLKRAPYFAMGWFLFVTTLIPVIGIVQVGRQAMADRYAYVPAIGLFIIATWGVSSMIDVIAIPRLTPTLSALVLLLASGTATCRYLSCWQNGMKLFSHARTVASQPDFFIEEGLAENLASSGHLADALLHYREACRLRPNFDRCHYKMAELLSDAGQVREALEQYELLGNSADSKEIALLGMTNAGKILLDLGDYDAAEMRLITALQLDPNNNNARLLLQRTFNERNSHNRQAHKDLH